MLSIVLANLLACSSSDDDDDVGTSETADTGTPPLENDQGSITLTLTEPSWTNPVAETVLAGLFVADAQGWLNLASCVTSPVGICIDVEPPLFHDTYAVAADADPAILTSLETRHVGPTLTMGPWSADYTFDEVIGVGFYFGSRASGADPFGLVGPTFAGGEWAPVDLPDLLPFPTPIDLTSHAPDQLAELHAKEQVPLRWTPGVEGDVWLLLDATGQKRVYALEDDGAFDLDLNDLLLSEGERVDLVLERRTRAAVEVAGNDLDVDVVSVVTLAATWSTGGTRTDLTDLADACEEAEVAPPLGSGTYTGELSGLTNDSDPGPGGCTGTFGAEGPDAIFPLQLLPQDLVEIDLRLVGDDAVVYLLSECGEPDSCLVGADTTGASGTESIEWLHDAEAPATVWLVVDSFGDVTGPFLLDVVITSLGGSILVPTCVDAIAAGPASSGSWHGTLAGNTDVLDPECAAPANGGEGMTQVYLKAGESLTASVETPAGGNPKLYLLYNCGIPESCTEVADADTGTFETLTYVNETPFSEYLYLVLDGETGIGEYFLDLTIP